MAEVSLALQEEEEAVGNLDKCIPLIKEWEEHESTINNFDQGKILMFQEEYEQANNELASARSQFELLGDKRGLPKHYTYLDNSSLNRMK